MADVMAGGSVDTKGRTNVLRELNQGLGTCVKYGGSFKCFSREGQGITCFRREGWEKVKST